MYSNIRSNFVVAVVAVVVVVVVVASFISKQSPEIGLTLIDCNDIIQMVCMCVCVCT